MKRKKWFADVILLAGIVLAGAIFGLFLYLKSDTGAMVRVRTTGKDTELYPLDEDGEFVLKNPYGETNTLVIENGEAYVKDASCPDGICESMGKISKSEQSIVCLPNEVVIDIINDNAEDTGTDIISQ